MQQALLEKLQKARENFNKGKPRFVKSENSHKLLFIISIIMKVDH